VGQVLVLQVIASSLCAHQAPRYRSERTHHNETGTTESTVRNTQSTLRASDAYRGFGILERRLSLFLGEEHASEAIIERGGHRGAKYVHVHVIIEKVGDHTLVVSCEGSKRGRAGESTLGDE
jgi:hypothetical protein